MEEDMKFDIPKESVYVKFISYLTDDPFYGLCIPFVTTQGYLTNANVRTMITGDNKIKRYLN